MRMCVELETSRFLQGKVENNSKNKWIDLQSPPSVWNMRLSYEKNVWLRVDYQKAVQPENEILICVAVHILLWLNL